MEDDVLDVVGLMAHEDDGRARVWRDSEVEVGSARACVIGAGQPEEIAATLEGEVAVDKDRGSVGFEGRDDVVGADIDVVVAENAETLGSLEGGEDLGSDAGGAPGGSEGERAATDKITRDEDEVWGHGVDLGDHLLEEPGFGELLKVDVAHLDDAEVLKAVREIADRDGEAGDFELVARMGSRVRLATPRPAAARVAPRKPRQREVMRSLAGPFTGGTSMHTP